MIDLKNIEPLQIIDYSLNEMANPRKENRYVNDITFATRLKHFIEHTGKTYGASDFLIDEEWEYLLYVVNKLVNWQKENANEKDLKYFENLNR